MSENHNGLIFAWPLTGEGNSIDRDEAIRRFSEGDPVLLHLDYSDPQSARWLNEQSGLHPISAAMLSADETRPRFEEVEDGIVVILRGVNTNPGANPEDMVSVRIWTDGQRVVSCRKRFLVSENDILKAFQRGRGPRSAGDYLTLMAEKMVSRMVEVIEDMEDASDELSERLLTGDTQALRSELAEVKRTIIRLRRYLAPQREALTAAYESEAEWLTDLHRARLREIADHTLRFLEDLDAARERATVTQEELQQHFTEQAERRMFLLAVVTTVFLPLSFVTGLLGINVGGIPGAAHPFAFPLVTLFLALVAAGVLGLLWWRRWF